MLFLALNSSQFWFPIWWLFNCSFMLWSIFGDFFLNVYPFILYLQYSNIWRNWFQLSGMKLLRDSIVGTGLISKTWPSFGIIVQFFLGWIITVMTHGTVGHRTIYKEESFRRQMLSGIDWSRTKTTSSEQREAVKSSSRFFTRTCSPSRLSTRRRWERPVKSIQAFGIACTSPRALALQGTSSRRYSSQCSV